MNEAELPWTSPCLYFGSALLLTLVSPFELRVKRISLRAGSIVHLDEPAGMGWNAHTALPSGCASIGQSRCRPLEKGNAAEIFCSARKPVLRNAKL